MHNMHDLRVSDGKKSKRAAKRRINIGYAAVKVAHCGGSHHINANMHQRKGEREEAERGGGAAERGRGAWYAICNSYSKQ